MTEETIAILVRAKISYDETKAGAREYVAQQATNVRPAQARHKILPKLIASGAITGPYTVEFLPGGELLSDQPTPPPDITLCPRLSEKAAFLRAWALHVDPPLPKPDAKELLAAADLMDEAREAIANASGVQCDIAEYHLGRLFKLWARLDQLTAALKTAAPDTLREIEESWNKEQPDGK